jgi:hypothetical protein
VRVHLLGAELESVSTAVLPPIVRVAVRTEDDTASAAGDVSWHGANGGLLGHGRSLPLDVLPVGVHAVTASVADAGDGAGSATFLIERTRDSRYRWHRGTVTYPEPHCARRRRVTATRARHAPRLTHSASWKIDMLIVNDFDLRSTASKARARARTADRLAASQRVRSAISGAHADSTPPSRRRMANPPTSATSTYG